MEESTTLESTGRRDDAVLAELIENHIGYAKSLVVQFCRERGHPPVERKELLSAALLGLCEAARRYDGSKSSAFSTYAYFRIRGAMFDFLRAQGERSRRTPIDPHTEQEGTSLRRGRRSAYRSKSDFAASMLPITPGRNASTSICEELGIKIHFGAQDQAFDFSSARSDSPEELLLSDEAWKQMNIMIDRMPELERKIIRAHYFEGRTLEEIRTSMGRHSKSWFSRVHSRAVARLRSLTHESLNAHV